jgi:hypothetical protein
MCDLSERATLWVIDAHTLVTAVAAGVAWGRHPLHVKLAAVISLGASMPDKGWKRAERQHARDVGTERIPVTGERDGADFVSGPFAYQLKVRKVIPAWIGAWLGGICAMAARSNRTGVLVLNRPHRPRRAALVVLRWSDWVELHGGDGDE